MDDIFDIADALNGADPEPIKVGDKVFVPVITGDPAPLMSYIRYDDLRSEMDLDDDGTSDFRIN